MMRANFRIDRMVCFFLCFCGILALIFNPSFSLAQKKDSLLKVLIESSIPVTEISHDEETIKVYLHYDLELDHAMWKLEFDQAKIFNKLVTAFPKAKLVRIYCRVKEEDILEMEIDFPVLRDFVNGKISEDSFYEKLRGKPLVNFGERLPGERVDGILPGEDLDLFFETTTGSITPSGGLTGSSGGEEGSSGRRGGGGGSGDSGGIASFSLASKWPLFLLIFMVVGVVILTSAILFRRRSGLSTEAKVDAMLEVMYKDGSHKDIGIGRQGITIGRGETNTLRLNDPGVSTYHAEIIIDDRNFVLRDLGSMNGTSVNGENITEKVLYAGDKIQLGATTLILR